jgi:hypothetical protein
MAIVVCVFVVLVGLAYLGWRKRKREQSALIAAPKPAPPYGELGKTFGRFEGQYVATTKAGEPLERIVVGNLGFRAHALVVVTEGGILIGIPGSDVFIPAKDLRGQGTATWTIDRAVEEGGLRLVSWSLGETPVESYFRMNEPKAFANAVESVLTMRVERKTS